MLSAALGGCFSTAIALHTRAVSPRNERWQTGATNLHSKRIALGLTATAVSDCTSRLVVEYLLTAEMLRRINSMDKPNGRLVLVSYAHYCASTSSLSTRWSSWALLFPFGLGDLILGRASRLYAFSGYHNRTSLPSRALGRTTGTQEVRPSRSSRTKDSPPQISYAHSR
jgi:hypothetical protein